MPPIYIYAAQPGAVNQQLWSNFIDCILKNTKCNTCALWLTLFGLWTEITCKPLLFSWYHAAARSVHLKAYSVGMWTGLWYKYTTICVTCFTTGWMYRKLWHQTSIEINELTVCCLTTCFSEIPQLEERSWPLPDWLFLQFSSIFTDLSRCGNTEIYSCSLFMTS